MAEDELNNRQFENTESNNLNANSAGEQDPFSSFRSPSNADFQKAMEASSQNDRSAMSTLPDNFSIDFSKDGQSKQKQSGQQGEAKPEPYNPPNAAADKYAQQSQQSQGLEDNSQSKHQNEKSAIVNVPPGAKPIPQDAPVPPGGDDLPKDAGPNPEFPKEAHKEAAPDTFKSEAESSKSLPEIDFGKDDIQQVSFNDGNSEEKQAQKDLEGLKDGQTMSFENGKVHKTFINDRNGKQDVLKVGNHILDKNSAKLKQDENGEYSITGRPIGGGVDPATGKPRMTEIKLGRRQ